MTKNSNQGGGGPALTDDDAVHRNVSIRYYKIKIIPPLSPLQTQLTMRVISARLFGSLKRWKGKGKRKKEEEGVIGCVISAKLVVGLCYLSTLHVYK